MTEKQKNLIVFYSHEGNIRNIAKHIQSVIDADIYDIELKTPYSEDNEEFVKTVRNEIKEDIGHDIIEKPINVNFYDNVIIGSANWGKTITPAMKQFLQENDLSEVTVYPYFSHGGTGIGHMQEDIKEFSNCQSIKEPLVIYQTTLLDEDIKNWIKK